jgi:hypothetical protein
MELLWANTQLLSAIRHMFRKKRRHTDDVPYFALYEAQEKKI